MISFWRSQATSLISSAADFGLFGFLFSLLAVNYVLASALGNVAGAIVSFYLGRNWSFKSQDGNVSNQAIKYAITSLSSLGINSVGIVLLTENSSLTPGYSKIIIALFVGITFNFFMFRYFVFKK